MEDLKKHLAKAQTLIEALPYIREFNGKTVVIKYGGSAMVEDELSTKVIEDVVLMRLVGINPVIVHGGGKHISEVSNKMGLESRFLNGLRVTDHETMKVTQMVLAGLVSKDIVAKIELYGGKACGISGKDGSLIEAVKKEGDAGEDYGLVGEIKKVNPELLSILEREGYIPVVSPIAVDHEGKSLNINADIAAARIAEELKAEKIIFLTDVDGIMQNPDDPSTIISHIGFNRVDELIEEGVIKGGMLPKVSSCVRAIKEGVRKVHIINGTIPHALMLEVFTEKGVGTEITAD